MFNIAIYGAGGFGKEVACLIKRINQADETPTWNLIGFFDDAKPTGTPVSHFGNVVGDINTLNAWTTPLHLAVAVGAPHALARITASIHNPLVQFPNLIDTSFQLWDPDTTSMGHGNIIVGPGSLSCDVTLGDFNILVGGVVVGHDTHIGNCNVFMPGARVSGMVDIGNENLLGANSIILQRLRIGNNVTLAMASALMTTPADGSTYIGVPATEFAAFT